MPHHITAIILKGKFAEEKAKEYDLLPIQLDYNLTIFFINHYYTAYWQYKKLKKKSNLDLNLHECPIIFPTEEVISLIVAELSLEDALFTIIHTDYFGGIGEQYACVFKNNINQNKSIRSINEALLILGVIKKEGLDEFDTIGLSNYRSEPDYLEKYYDLVDELGL